MEVLKLGVTQKNIADLLNIDRTTVTKALSGSPDISEAMKTRIKALCDELGYRPNYHSKSLRTKETRVISVLKTGLGLSHLLSLWIDRLNYWAHEEGYSIRLESIDDIDAILAEQSADGFISFHGPADGPQLRDQISKPVKPIVFTDCGLNDYNCNSVAVDNMGGASEAVKHVVELGHRQVAFFGLVSNSGVCRDRHAGYVRQLNNLGLPAPERYIVPLNRWPEEPQEAYCREDEVVGLVKTGVTAFIAASDIGAVGIIKILRRHGISVPRDVAVAGFDDSLAAKVCEPMLTSVGQDVDDAAKAAVSMLLRVLRERKAQPNVVVGSRLVVRDSTVVNR